MNVQDIMTAKPLACRPQTNLAEVVHEMWQADCGIIPVTDDAGKVLGVITDRDIAVAAATRDQAPSYMRASELVRHAAICCRVTDTVQDALKLMQQYRVRRLPVVNADGVLAGIVSMNDVVLEVKPGSGVTAAQVVQALQAICGHHHPPATTRPPQARPPKPRRESHAA